MAKNRRKKRRRQRGGQAAAPLPQPVRPGPVAPESRPDVVAARPSGPGSDGTVVGTVVEVEREILWLDVGGVRSMLYASELMLGIGERPADRYAVDDRFEAFAFQMDPDHDLGAAQFSIRRASPYPEALAGLGVGSEVQATVVNTYDEGIELDIGGVRGNIFHRGLPLSVGESTHQRYQPEEQITARIHAINVEDRELELSARQYAPGYLEALQQRSVGDVVSGTVTAFWSGGYGLWLDVDGLVGGVGPQDLDLDDGESAWDRYTVGDTIDGLFVWDIDHEARDLDLSVKRDAPGYVKALQQYVVGEVVSAIVTAFEGEGDGGLWLDVDGLVGGVGPQDLDLDDGESAWDRYTVGDTIDGLFVWDIDHEARDLDLSVKRDAPGYAEALQRHAVGDAVLGTIIDADDDGLWLNVDGLVGYAPPEELDLDDGESAQDRYTVGNTIDGLFVWQVDHEARDLILSAKRNAPGYLDALDAIARGDEIDGIVALSNRWGVWLSAAGVVGWIPASELLLDDGESPQTRYTAGDEIKARVWEIDHEARDIVLSVRRLELDFPEETITKGAVIDAVVRGTPPRGTRSPIRVLAAGEEIWIPPHVLSLSTAVPRSFKDGQGIRVVVTDLDEDDRPDSLSHRRTLDRWAAEVERLQRGVLVARARVVPRGGVPDTEDRLAVDLGPITGYVANDELDRDFAANLMNFGANEVHRVVVESVDAEIGGATIVSNDKFAARWNELAEAVSEDEEIEAELRDIDGGKAFLDLGSGLLAEMPVEQLPARAEGGGAEQDRTGETVTVQIKSIEAETYTIAAEIRNYDLVQMIAADETLVCELKAVFLKGVQPESPRARQNRQDVNRSVVRAMAGMMNRDGGHVIVGVQDTDKKDGEVVGWEASGWENQNRMVTELSKLVARVLGSVAGGLVTPRFKMLPDGHEVLDIDCEPAAEPIFLIDGQREEFPVRYPAMTKNLTARDQHEYIQGRFYGRGAAEV